MIFLEVKNKYSTVLYNEVKFKNKNNKNGIKNINKQRQTKILAK